MVGNRGAGEGRPSRVGRLAINRLAGTEAGMTPEAGGCAAGPGTRDSSEPSGNSSSEMNRRPRDKGRIHPLPMRHHIGPDTDQRRIQRHPMRLQYRFQLCPRRLQCPFQRCPMRLQGLLVGAPSGGVLLDQVSDHAAHNGQHGNYDYPKYYDRHAFSLLFGVPQRDADAA